MTNMLNRLFNVRDKEWPQVLLLFGVAMLTNIAATWGTTIAYANFPNTALPRIQILSAILSLLVAAIYSALVDRVPDKHLLIAIYVIGAGGVALGWIGLLNQYDLAYQLLYLFDLVWTIAFNAHFATFVSNFYDIHAAKRILPVVFAGFRSGVIIAGFTKANLTRYLSIPTVIAIWGAMYLLIALLMLLLPRLLKKAEAPLPAQTPVSAEKSQRLSYIASLLEGLRYTQQSTYLRWIAANTLLFTVLLTLLEFESRAILIEHYSTGDRFSNMLALLAAIGNAIILPLLLFGISRIITRFGVGNVSLAFPLGNLAVCSAIAFSPAPASGIAGYFDRTAFRTAIQSPINKLLYNAVPVRLRGRSRAFVDGLIVPIGTLIGGVISLLPNAFAEIPWLVRALIFTLAVAYWGSAVIIRREYSRALVKMLEQEDYSFLLTQESAELTLTDPAMLTRLQEKLETSTSHELTVFMASLISQVGGSSALSILQQTAQRSSESRTRAAILDILSTSNLSIGAARKIFAEFLSDPDPAVRQSAITGLEIVAGASDKQFVNQILELAHDPDLNVRARALNALIPTGTFFALEPAAAALEALLAAELPYERALGVRILGQIHTAQAASRLFPYLSDVADEVRLEAVLALESELQALPTGAEEQQALKSAMLALLRDPVEATRRAALNVLGQLDAADTYPVIAEALGDPSQQIRTTAADVLVQRGKSMTPLVRARLESDDPITRKMAAFTLCRIDPKEFDTLVLEHIAADMQAIYANTVHAHALSPCAKCRGIVIARNVFDEQSRELLAGIFYLLTGLHAPEAVAIVHDSLQSNEAYTRANAVEALEALTTPKTAQLIAPLFDPALQPEQLLTIAGATWNLRPPTLAEALRSTVVGSDAWLRAIATYALGEMGAQLRPAQTARASEAPPRRERAGGRDDLFAALADVGGDKPKPAARRERGLGDLFAAISEPGKEKPTEPAAAVKPETRRDVKDPKALLQALGDPAPAPAAAAAAAPPTIPGVPFTLAEIETLLETALRDEAEEVRSAAQSAKRLLAGAPMSRGTQEEPIMLSTIEKIIFLKEVPFFQNMTVAQLKILASVCEEEMFAEDALIYDEGDPGGALYVVVNGRVGIEQRKRSDSVARLATIEAYSYFGEMDFFNSSPRSNFAVAIQDTLALRLRREPLMAHIRQQPNMSLELINVLSERLREANDRIAELAKSRPRQLQKLFDQYE